MASIMLLASILAHAEGEIGNVAWGLVLHTQTHNIEQGIEVPPALVTSDKSFPSPNPNSEARADALQDRLFVLNKHKHGQTDGWLLSLHATTDFDFFGL
eukprot:5677136-Amphidinium_carterae.1